MTAVGFCLDRADEPSSDASGGPAAASAAGRVQSAKARRPEPVRGVGADAVLRGGSRPTKGDYNQTIQALGREEERYPGAAPTGLTAPGAAPTIEYKAFPGSGAIGVCCVRRLLSDAPRQLRFGDERVHWNIRRGS